MHYSTEIFKISSSVLKRFEENLENGTFFLFNAENEEMWVGNYSSKILSELLDGRKDAAAIKEEFARILGMDNNAEMNESVDTVLSELEEKNIIVRV